MSNNKISTPSTGLAKAIRQMLRPLVKLLMHKGITYMGMVEVLKETYVEVAEQDKSFHLKNKRQTDSRISLLTGVHRGEVKRIRESFDDQATEKEIRASISAQIMARWMGHSNYSDQNGMPIALLKTSEEGKSFETLVFEVSRDKHPRSILDDWQKQGLVEIDDQNLIHLKQDGYTASEDIEEKLFFAGKNIAEHLNTVSHNLTWLDDPRFDRALYYHHLSEQSVRDIETLAQDELLKALKKINQITAEKQQQDDKIEPRPDQSIHIGAYLSKTGGTPDEE